MNTYAMVLAGRVISLSAEPIPPDPDLSCVDVTNILPLPAPGWLATDENGEWTFTPSDDVVSGFAFPPTGGV